MWTFLPSYMLLHATWLISVVKWLYENLGVSKRFIHSFHWLPRGAPAPQILKASASDLKLDSKIAITSRSFL